MALVARILVGLVGLLFLGLMLGAWARPEALAAAMDLSATGALGLAAIRADLGGFFGAGGAFALAAAVTGRREFLLPPLALVGLALLGRLITAASGFTPAMAAPMVIEVALVALFALGRRVLDGPNRTT
jgi:hypothetical protein